jgi:uncharacterized delta-60 repeat protein
LAVRVQALDERDHRGSIHRSGASDLAPRAEERRFTLAEERLLLTSRTMSLVRFLAVSRGVVGEGERAEGRVGRGRYPIASLGLLLVASMALGLPACGGDDTGDDYRPPRPSGSGGAGGTASMAGGGGNGGGVNGGTGGGMPAGGGAGAGGAGGQVVPAPRWRLDPSFGEGGRLVAGELGVDVERMLKAVALADGGFALLNRERRWLSRYSASGRRDDAFGWDGVATFGFGPFSPTTLIELRDGRIALGGYAPLSFREVPAVAIVTARGEFDFEFGVDGLASLADESLDYGSVWALAEQPDGKIVGTGYAEYNYDDGQITFRFTRQGAPDPAFGPVDAGFTYSVSAYLSPFGEGTGAVFPTLDGTIVVAGSLPGTVGPIDEADFGLHRYEADGTNDYSFGTYGTVHVDGGPSPDAPGDPSNACLHAARLPDGRVVMSGSHGYDQADRLVARLLPDGTPDPSFGAGGFWKLNLSEQSTDSIPPDSTAVAPDGSVLLIGRDYGPDFAPYYDFAIRLLPDGQPDPDFGQAGTMRFDEIVGLEALTMRSVTGLTDGSFLLGGVDFEGSYFFYRLAPP